MNKYLKATLGFLAVIILLLSAYMVVIDSRNKELTIANSQRFTVDNVKRFVSLGDYSSSHD